MCQKVCQKVGWTDDAMVDPAAYISKRISAILSRLIYPYIFLLYYSEQALPPYRSFALGDHTFHSLP